MNANEQFLNFEKNNQTLNKEDIKEDFCPSCLVVPIAFAGAGATAAGTTVSQKHKTMKKALLISGVVTVILTLIIGGYYIFYKKDCKECSMNF